MSRPTPDQALSPPADPVRAGSARRGTWLVAGLVLLGLAAAVTGVWFQRHQTRRCLAFYGPTAARRITVAPTVELLLVQPGAGPGLLTAHTRIDVSKAPGLVHLRRGLVEDANFAWPPGSESGSESGSKSGRTMADAGGAGSAGSPARLPPDAWDVAIVFSEPDGSRTGARAGDRGPTTLVIDFDRAGGALAVVGQPGRIGLGRIGPGLEKWIRSTLAAH